MIKKKAFKFLLEPSKSQISDVLVFAGACRFVYNKGLALLSENYNNGKPFLNYNKLAPLLVEWKNDNKLEWLKLCPSQCLQQSLRDHSILDLKRKAAVIPLESHAKELD